MIKKLCNFPSCGELVAHPESRCPDHKRQVEKIDRQYRGSAYERGYDRKWQKIREDHLDQYPLCGMCLELGQVTPADLVDHILPLEDGGTHDPENLNSLCIEHHALKTANDLRKRNGR